MNCPKCNSSTYVKDTVRDVENNEFLRLRICKNCKHRFYTFEAMAEMDEEFYRTWRDNHRRTKPWKGLRRYGQEEE